MNVMSLASFRSTRSSLVLVGVVALVLAACGGGTAKKAVAVGGSGNAPKFDSCLADTATQNALANLDSNANLVRGGLLYDAWFEVSGVKTSTAPATDHALWATRDAVASPSDAKGADTWRCSTCHGWDYNGGVDGENAGGNVVLPVTGFKGVLDMALNDGAAAPEKIFCAIKSGTDATSGKHNFSAQLSDNDVLDLTKFIAQEGVVDTLQYIAPNAGTLGKPDLGGKAYTAQSCGSTKGCHGPLGDKQPNGSDMLGEMAATNPWEFLHKVRFGAAASGSMAAYEGLAADGGLSQLDIVDLIAYAQLSLTGGGGAVIAPIDGATGGGGGGGGGTGKFTGKVLGGRLFDNLFEVTGMDVTKLTTSNPLYLALTNKVETDFPTTDEKADTWRCSTCHGWDYKGQNGVNGTSNGAVPGLLQNVFAQMKIDDPTPAGLQNALDSAYNYVKSGFKDPVKGVVHAFGAPIVAGASALSEAQLRALADFVVNGLVDSSKYVLNSRGQKQVLGDPVAGKALYDAAAGATGGGCGTSACHAADGKHIDFVDDDPATAPNEFVGTVANDNPWETFHRISFGAPNDASMPSAVANGLTTSQIINILDYAQSLPGQ